MRLLRLPNTVHEKSQLYKTLLTPAALVKLTPTTFANGRVSHATALTDETGLLSHAVVAENPAANELLMRVKRQFKKLTPRPVPTIASAGRWT